MKGTAISIIAINFESIALLLEVLRVWQNYLQSKILWNSILIPCFISYVLVKIMQQRALLYSLLSACSWLKKAICYVTRRRAAFLPSRPTRMHRESSCPIETHISCPIKITSNSYIRWYNGLKLQKCHLRSSVAGSILQCYWLQILDHKTEWRIRRIFQNRHLASVVRIDDTKVVLASCQENHTRRLLWKGCVSIL